VLSPNGLEKTQNAPRDRIPISDKDVVGRLSRLCAMEAIDVLGVHPPTFAARQDMNAPIAIAQAGRRNFLDPSAN
jgi:hypothetical protein